MNIKTTLLGTLAYTLVTFPLAVIWHIVLFEQQYLQFSYFEGEPNFLLGLLTIIIQGFVLSFLYPYVKFSGGKYTRSLKYASVLGVFFWSSHVLAFVAKQKVDSSTLFIAMESFYLMLQFGFYGLLIGKIAAISQNEATQTQDFRQEISGTSE